MPPSVRSCNLGLEHDDDKKRWLRVPMIEQRHMRVAPKCVRVTSSFAAVALFLLLMARSFGMGTVYHSLI